MTGHTVDPNHWIPLPQAPAALSAHEAKEADNG